VTTSPKTYLAWHLCSFVQVLLNGAQEFRQSPLDHLHAVRRRREIAADDIVDDLARDRYQAVLPFEADREDQVPAVRPQLIGIFKLQLAQPNPRAKTRAHIFRNELNTSLLEAGLDADEILLRRIEPRMVLKVGDRRARDLRSLRQLILRPADQGSRGGALFGGDRCCSHYDRHSVKLFISYKH